MPPFVAAVAAVASAVSATAATVGAAAAAVGAGAATALGATAGGALATGIGATAGALAGGAVTGAIYGGAIGGTFSAAQGGDFWEGAQAGATTGALTFGVGSAAGGLFSGVASGAAGAIGFGAKASQVIGTSLSYGAGAYGGAKAAGLSDKNAAIAGALYGGTYGLNAAQTFDLNQTYSNTFNRPGVPGPATSPGNAELFTPAAPGSVSMSETVAGLFSSAGGIGTTALSLLGSTAPAVASSTPAYASPDATSAPIAENVQDAEGEIVARKAVPGETEFGFGINKSFEPGLVAGLPEATTTSRQSIEQRRKDFATRSLGFQLAA